MMLDNERVLLVILSLRSFTPAGEYDYFRSISASPKGAIYKYDMQLSKPQEQDDLSMNYFN